MIQQYEENEHSQNVKIDAFTTLDLEICSWVAGREVLCVGMDVCCNVRMRNDRACQIFQSHRNKINA